MNLRESLATMVFSCDVRLISKLWGNRGRTPFPISKPKFGALCYNPSAESNRLSQYFNKRCKSVITASLAWVLAQSGVTAAILGASKADQLDLTSKPADFTIDEDEKAFCNLAWCNLPRPAIPPG